MCASDEDERRDTARPRDCAAGRAAPSTMRVAVRRFEAAGLSWPPDDVTDAVLEARLFARSVISSRRAAAPRRARLRSHVTRTQSQARDAAIYQKSTLPPSAIGTHASARSSPIEI